MAVDRDKPRTGIVKAHQQPDQRALPRPARPDESHVSAPRNAGFDVDQVGVVSVVAEIDV